MPGTSDTADALPLVEWGGSCQNPLKRTLRLRTCSAVRPLSRVILPGSAGDFGLMVNDRFPAPRVRVRNAAERKRIFVIPRGRYALIQIPPMPDRSNCLKI